jgi:hypothetical protein
MHDSEIDMSRWKKGEFVASLGDGRFGVAYGKRSVWLIDTLTGTRIVIYYHPYHRQWYIMLTDPQGNFVKRLNYISVCATGVFEYCQRTSESSNLYVDVLFCVPIRDLELTSYWQPWEPILVLYRLGNRRPYYRWLRAVLPEIARQIAMRIQEAGNEAANFVIQVFELGYGLKPQYIGYAVTGYKYCAGILYGIQCRLTPEICEPTRCKPVCTALWRLFPAECSEERERQCLAGEVYRPIPKNLYGRE